MATDLRVTLDEKNTDSAAFDVGAKLQFKPVGASGTSLFSGYFSEEYLLKLRGRSGAKIFDEIRRSEAQVAMLLGAIMNPIKSATCEFDVPPIENGQLHKDLIEYCAKEMIDFETHLHEALTMLTHGYSIVEVIHNVVFEHKKFGTFNGLKALAFRSQKTIERWIVDNETGALQQVEQWIQGDTVAQGSAQKLMDAQHLLIFTNQKEGDNYEGISVLRPMYGPWFRKNLYLQIAAIGIEKHAIGTPIGTVPAGVLKKEEKDEFAKVLSNFTANEGAYLMKPAGWDIDVIKSDFDATTVKEMILLENTEMINAVIANFLALGTNGGGGAFALGTDLSDFFLAGIQNYANIIAGVWNRVLIPNLIKMNFGGQEQYPRMKFTGISDKAGTELATVLNNLVTSKIIKPDDKLEESIRKRYDLPPSDPATARDTNPAPAPYGGGAQFSEKRIKLAETYKKQWDKDKESLKTLMQDNLKILVDNFIKQIKSGFASATTAQKATLALGLEPRGLNNYKAALKEELARIANVGLESARRDTPKAKNVKLSEAIKLAAPKGGYFDALPTAIKRLVSTQAALIGETQASDLLKIIAFQYGSSYSSTEDIDVITNDIEDAVLPSIDGATGKGMGIDAAAGNATSSIVNQARLEWFFEPEVLDGIESFTFYNEDPVSEICQELDGMTWAVNDPDLDRYSPPLHHNCKSRLVPNEKGGDNPEIQRGGTPVSQKGLDSITLCDCIDSYKLKV